MGFSTGTDKTNYCNNGACCVVFQDEFHRADGHNGRWFDLRGSWSAYSTADFDVAGELMEIRNARSAIGHVIEFGSGCPPLNVGTAVGRRWSIDLQLAGDGDEAGLILPRSLTGGFGGTDNLVEYFLAVVAGSEGFVRMYLRRITTATSTIDSEAVVRECPVDAATGEPHTLAFVVERPDGGDETAPIIGSVWFDGEHLFSTPVLGTPFSHGTLFGFESYVGVEVKTLGGEPVLVSRVEKEKLYALGANPDCPVVEAGPWPTGWPLPMTVGCIILPGDDPQFAGYCVLGHDPDNPLIGNHYAAWSRVLATRISRTVATVEYPGTFDLLTAFANPAANPSVPDKLGDILFGAQAWVEFDGSPPSSIVHQWNTNSSDDPAGSNRAEPMAIEYDDVDLFADAGNVILFPGLGTLQLSAGGTDFSAGGVDCGIGAN